MASLSGSMPPVIIPEEPLRKWGELWRGTLNPQTGKSKRPDCFNRQQSVNFAGFIDEEVAKSFAAMLGNIPVRHATKARLTPLEADCVEVGPTRIIGGVRPQNFDVAYRPDGPRIAFDSKTLNDLSSVRKNWQNMVNDLATEAATVHTRFPYALVAFMVVIPEPALASKQLSDLTRTLERLSTRKDVLDQTHLAEAIALVVWNPDTGKVSETTPPISSPLRIEQFSNLIYPHYLNRYKGLPPHDEVSDDDENDDDETV